MWYALTLAWGQRMQFGQLNRREVVTLLGSAVAWPLVSHTQQPAMMPFDGKRMIYGGFEPIIER
jgi:hypothetical protein